jgi:hypothetical protein
MTESIRIATFLDIEKRVGPVEVCEHIELPSAYPEPSDACEYAQQLQIRCSECEQTYEYTIKVN